MRMRSKWSAFFFIRKNRTSDGALPYQDAILSPFVSFRGCYSVEQRPFKALVVGSSPTQPTCPNPLKTSGLHRKREHKRFLARSSPIRQAPPYPPQARTAAASAFSLVGWNSRRPTPFSPVWRSTWYALHSGVVEGSNLKCNLVKRRAPLPPLLSCRLPTRWWFTAPSIAQKTAKALSTQSSKFYRTRVEGPPVTDCWVVYVLRCRDDSLYCGITTDLERRLEMHNTGRGAKYTRGRCPSSVLHSWIVPDKRAAILEERAFKALSRRGKMDFLSRQRSAVDVAEPLRGCTDAATREG